MKLKVGRYHSQWGLGICYTCFNNLYRSILLDFIFFYIELVITDNPKNAARTERERLLAEMMQRDQELGLYDD